MKTVKAWLEDSGIAPAVEELKAAVLSHYPDATFEFRNADDPEGLYILAVVDVEDSTEVISAICDEIFDVQVERYQPVYVVALRPVQRGIATAPPPRDTAVA
jgi:hypothetical protein